VQVRECLLHFVQEPTWGYIQGYIQISEQGHTMKHICMILLMAACAAAAGSQSLANPATNAASAPKENCSTAAGIALPASIPPVQGDVQSVIALRYQDYVIGTGAEAEPGKVYKVQYTYWLADGTKIDSTLDHPGAPLKGVDGKVIMGADGKPKLGPPMTVNFTQGRHQMIFGIDQGLAGMRVGGKRRLYIPWQLAWGAMGHPPAIPAMSDMIYDVELVDVTDPPSAPLPPTGRSGIGDLRGRRSVGGQPPASGTPAPASTAAPAAQPQSK
jgi:peptidylprolyl isomerase